MEGGSSLQAPKEESLRQHVLMDPVLLIPEISTSQAWWTDQLFSENQKSPTRWSHLIHSLHFCHWWHLWPAVLPHPTGAACRRPSVMDQSRACDHRSHQDAGSNESHLRLGKRVAGNDQQNQDWSHLLLPVSQERRVHPADQWIRNPPARHPNIPRSEVRQKTDLVSPQQYHAQQRPQENGPDEETGRNKMGSQHENLDPGLHRNCQTPHGVCLQCPVICCKETNLDQLTKTQNAGLRITTGGMKTTPISELERTAGLLSLGERIEEKLLRQSEKMKRLPSHPLHSKFEAPTKNRLKRQSPNHLVKALQQKHRIPSSARNQSLEMLQNYEDWQAETPIIILDIPGIQAKDHHTDEELRSLTLKVLSVAYLSTTWAKAYTDGSAEEAAINWRRWSFH